MRDVRRDFPNPGDVKKLFSDWYLEDENMDVITSLATLQASVHEVLMNFAMEETIGLLYVCLILLAVLHFFDRMSIGIATVI